MTPDERLVKIRKTYANTFGALVEQYQAQGRAVGHTHTMIHGIGPGTTVWVANQHHVRVLTQQLDILGMMLRVRVASVDDLTRFSRPVGPMTIDHFALEILHARMVEVITK